jgi:CheY-like chemotaxis protein
VVRKEILMVHVKDKEETVEILLVEDNRADALLMEEALRESAFPNNLSVVRNGEEAMEYLYRRGQFEQSSRPDLIMLDLNLPKKDGREVLAEIKNDQHLRAIPVVVITTSRSEEDIRKSYNLHANCYITKPVRLNAFFEVIRKIEDFWFTIVKLPPRGKS